MNSGDIAEQTTRAGRAAGREAERNNAPLEESVSKVQRDLSELNVNARAAAEQTPSRKPSTPEIEGSSAESTIDESGSLPSRAKEWDGLDQSTILPLFTNISHAFETWHTDDEGLDRTSLKAHDLREAIAELLKNEGIDRTTRATGNLMLAELSDDPVQMGKYFQNVKVLVELIEAAVRTNGLLRPPRLDSLIRSMEEYESATAD